MVGQSGSIFGPVQPWSEMLSLINYANLISWPFIFDPLDYYSVLGMVAFRPDYIFVLSLKIGLHNFKVFLLVAR